MGRFYHWLRAGPRPSYTHGTMSYAVKLGGVAIAILLIGVVAIVIFDRLWFRIGFGAALFVVFGGILLFAWNVDRKDKAKRAGLDQLPPV
jgi:Flp pilus assembly protein TadB